MHMLWFSIFLGWMFKSLVQRYGGMRGYLAGLPLFLGLILGDVVNAVVWIILGYLTRVGYQIMPKGRSHPDCAPTAFRTVKALLR